MFGGTFQAYIEDEMWFHYPDLYDKYDDNNETQAFGTFTRSMY